MSIGNTSKIASSPFAVTLSVWRALFLRESITRVTAGRAAWLWLLLEPIIHMSIMMFICTVIRVRVISGMHTAVWLTAGLLTMFMFMRTASQTKNAINSNRQLFAYRQVKPIDTIFSRAFLESFLTILIAFIMFASSFLLGFGVFPIDPLLLMSAFLGLWLTGLGYGLITSVISELIPEFDKVLKVAMGPIYMLSGVIFPISNVPSPYREWLLYNPIAHGIETARSSISPYYHSFAGLDISYTFKWALISIYLGLVLHKRFAAQLVTK